MRVPNTFKFEFGWAGALIDPPGSLVQQNTEDPVETKCKTSLSSCSVLATAFAPYNVVVCR